MKLSYIASFVLAICGLGSLATASTISGSVRNGTTNKAAAGDEVILLKLVSGMEEESRTRTDAAGRFTLEVQDSSATHLVRVNHQKVNYHAPAPPGTDSVGQIEVFDSAPKIQGIQGRADLMRMQTDGNTLHVTEMFVLRNMSEPRRTWMGDKTFEFYLPKGAQMDSSQATGPNGMAVVAAPVPQSDPGHYAFIFPLRPGETQFRVEYHMPYSGSATFAPRVSMPMEMLGIETPDSIQFSPARPGSFTKEVDQSGFPLHLATNVKPGAGPPFSISGTGVIPQNALRGQDGDSGGADSGASNAQATNRPGGGMATPEGTPDPMDKYRWPALIGLVALLAVGAFWMTRQQPASITGAAAVGAAASGNASSRLLEALKEELFQLETERLQQKISADEYAKAKAALDTTLARAMQRAKGS
jgi:hypothetical protein